MTPAARKPSSVDSPMIALGDPPPKANPSDFGSAMRFVGQFALSISDRLKVEKALFTLRALVKAEACMLIRVSEDRSRQRKIAETGPDEAPVPDAAKLAALLAGDACAVGTVHIIYDQANLAVNHSERSLSGAFAVLILRNTKNEADLVWLRFSGAPEIRTQTLLQDLTTALAEIWVQRKPGSISTMIIDNSRTHRARQHKERVGTILGMENVFDLSRAEFRVCNLIRKGLKPMQIAAELGVSIATVRSHLRGIYAKTELSGQMEVLHRLNQDTSTDMLGMVLQLPKAAASAS